IWSLFQIVMRLSELDLREPATRLLQSLIETSYIPPEAIQRTDQSSRDFHLIIALTLVRSCIFWKWYRRALALIRNHFHLHKRSSVGPVISGLSHDILYALMEYPTVEDLDLTISFVEDMVSSQEPISVSSDVIRQIYNHAQRLNQPDMAATLYTLTQGGTTQPLDEFPLPSGTALTWLLRYLSSQSAYLHLARRLVKQVVDRCEPIPPPDRADFISIAAKSGFASHARSLWERYSSGREGRAVAGNAAMVVRMCSLFTSLRRRNAVKKSEDSELAHETTIASIDSGPSHEAEDLCISSELDQDQDLRNFADLVLTRYRELKEPLYRASREDLNALARANIMLGRIVEGFQVLQIVTYRNECPDLHDINVILSAIADVDPRMALKMVRRMVAVGPKPDSISFGTVIHKAARHRDVATISRMLRLARNAGQQLTTKTVATVIRASVMLSGTDKDAIRDNLVRALGIITANDHSNHLSTVNMGTFCVEEALKADDPTLAFQFWKRLMRSRTPWDDGLHTSLRRRIEKSVCCRCKEGYIRTEDGRKMLFALRRGFKEGRRVKESYTT
ncbi:hypothetical protein B0F90DRAFT_1625646, partial [Multifurca ochricompacta]